MGVASLARGLTFGGAYETRERSMVALAIACLTALLLTGSPPANAKASPAKVSDPVTLAQQQATDLNRILAKARARLIRLARLPSVQERNPSACNADMAGLPAIGRYGVSGAADLEGNVFCLGIPFTPPLSIADRAYFLRAVGTRDLGVGDYQTGRVTGLGQIGLGFPTIASRRVTGIVLTVLSLDWLQRRITHRRPRGAVDVLVIDDHGTVLARAGRRPTRPGTNLGGNALVEAMLRHVQGEGTFRLGRKKLVRTAFDTVPLSDGNLHVAVSLRR
jgi:hypothetical protein